MQVSSLFAYYNNQWKDKMINLNVWTGKIGTHLFAYKSEQEDFGMMWFSIHESQFGYIIQEKSHKRHMGLKHLWNEKIYYADI